jgi:hypothetical protein
MSRQRTAAVRRSFSRASELPRTLVAGVRKFAVFDKERAVAALRRYDLIFVVHHVQQNLHAIGGYVGWRACKIPDLIVRQQIARLTFRAGDLVDAKNVVGRVVVGPRNLAGRFDCITPVARNRSPSCRSVRIPRPCRRPTGHWPFRPWQTPTPRQGRFPNAF